jgi:hypothetical protein
MSLNYFTLIEAHFDSLQVLHLEDLLLEVHHPVDLQEKEEKGLLEKVEKDHPEERGDRLREDHHLGVRLSLSQYFFDRLMTTLF